MYANAVMTIFNKRRGSDRRDVFFPTSISSCSFLESRGFRRSSDGLHSESLSYKIRIPHNAVIQDGRQYMSELTYAGLTDEAAASAWTIRKGDIVLMCETALAEPVDEPTLKALAVSLHRNAITVTEYADNTGRGSAAVKHWRIGGE